MLENIVRDLMVESKNKTMERYEEYLKKEQYDLIDVIELYFKVKFRDNISLEASNSSMRSLLKTYFDKACSKVMINKDAILKHLGDLHITNKNNPEHFNILSREIEKISNELRQINSLNIAIKDIDNEVKNEITLYERVCKELSDRDIYSNWTNVNIYKDSLIGEWKDGQPSLIIPCLETYMITDKVGDRNSNIGCYYGYSVDGKYVLVPQGIGYLNKITGNYNKTEPQYYNDRESFVHSLVDLIQYFYKLKYNK